MITLSMIVKDEEKFLSDCLASVRNVVDEMVIVDTGSADSTKKIAEEFGAKTFDFKWTNNFSAARNFALKNSTGDWILYLDADERLNSGSKELLLKLAAGSKKKAYSCIVNSIDEIKNRPSRMDYVRFFPRHPLVKFEGAVHEQIIPSLLKSSHELVRSEIEIIHLGYNISAEELKLKAKRNLDLLMNDYKRKKNSYTAFQIAQSYSLMGDEANAVYYFKIALQDYQLLNAYKSVSYRYLAAYELQKMKWDEALKLINKSLDADSNQPLSYLVLSQVYQGLKDFKEAELSCRKALEINRKLTSSNLATDMVIMVDEESILYKGLNICLISGDREAFNFYYSELKLSANKINDEIEFYNRLINDNQIQHDKLSLYLNTIKVDSQIELVLGLLKHYKQNKLIIMDAMHKKFSNNIRILNSLAAGYESINERTKAEQLLKKSITIEPNNPAPYFFLISLYLKVNNITEAFRIITEIENQFNFNPAITARVKVIKEEINNFLNSQH
ncbi:MAG: hypothetical protein AUK34_14765 [Ignavibacteria bacterium CG2_30_36_16]|nr:glycosyltransferase [Ignavibacteria bacterium]OIP54685.1 MAG: hypothetical protein AUK34_14765 [Ignavibacteria bacterium CG2_30_36_16]